MNQKGWRCSILISHLLDYWFPGKRSNAGKFTASLTFMTLWAISADDKLIFSYFLIPLPPTLPTPFKKNSFNIQCKLSPCMKYQSLFSVKIRKKYCEVSSAANFTQDAKLYPSEQLLIFFLFVKPYFIVKIRKKYCEVSSSTV